MPKKSKSSKPQVPKDYEDYFNPALFTSGYIPKRGRPKKVVPTYLDNFTDVIGVPTGFFDEKKGGGIKKLGRPKKKKKIVIKLGDKITNEKFKFSNQQVDFDFEYDGNKGLGGSEEYVAVSNEVDLGDKIVADVDDVEGGLNMLLEVLPDVIEEVFEEGMYEDTDLAQITIATEGDGEYLETDWETIGTIADSFESYLEDKTLWFNRVVDTKANFIGYASKKVFMNIRVVRNPYTGSGQKQVNSKKDFKGKKSVILVNNDDDLCFGRCLVIALAIRDNHPKLKQIKMGRNIQTELTHELYDSFGMEKKPSDLASIMEWEKWLNCSISIIDSDNFNNITYPVISDNYELKDFNIYLLKDGNHFHLVNNKQVAGFFCKDYFCHMCKKTYKCKDKHKCAFKCNICCSTDCFGVSTNKKENNWITCDGCWRSFPNQKCYDNHKLQEKITKGKNKGNMKKSVCDTIFKCPTCKKMYDKEKFSMETHRCGDAWCKNCDCKINTHDGHRCYMMPKPKKNPTDNIIFFDFECSQDTGRHTMNYGIAQYYHDPQSIAFLTIVDFMEWLLVEEHKGHAVIAHNGRGYDFQLCMEYIYQKTIYKPVIVYAGSKIMIMTIKELDIRFVDSLNFLTMPLANFPKTFGISELKKGFFPHYYNTTENFYYKGKVPPLRYFGYNHMDTKKRTELVKWWVAKRATNYYWDQFEEMKTYCVSDVDILRRSCIIFRELFMDVADIDPFQYTTIASVCMAIYKSDYIVNTNWNMEGKTGDEIKQYKQEIRLQAIKEQKIGIIPFEEQEFIRKSFFGGRTNSIKLKHNFTGDEIGVYSDITSLYPSVNYYDEYPTGHPVEITENFGDITKYFGFIDCYVIPPKGLYFPLLATKGKKLTFDLEPKRGVWTTIEMNKAIELGYVVKEVYKVLHYKKRSNNLFKGYVSKFLKIKQEASGKPEWVKTQHDLEKYLKDYEQKQGIKLDPSKIEYNAGLRAIAKLCLNSLWGKFGQRLNMPKNEIISDTNKFNKIMFNDQYTGQAWNMIDDERMEITYKVKDAYIEDDYNTNIAIASYTTSHARLRLYWALERLNRQVLYHDTDSVVYVYDKNNPKHFRITNGDLLGEWTDELDGVDMCGTFLGAGPKNYSYETTDGKLHTKIKGFTLDYSSTRDDGLTHKTMEDMIDARGTDKKIPIHYDMIIRDKKSKVMKTKPVVKKYGFVYDKRQVLPPDENGNIDTLPFGY